MSEMEHSKADLDKEKPGTNKSCGVDLQQDLESTSASSETEENKVGNILEVPVDNNCSDNLNPQQNPLLWVQTQIARCVDPKSILRELVPSINLPDNVPEMSIWKFIFEIITEPAPRQPLTHVRSLDSVVGLIRDCKNIVVLTGAGVSVSCGIPDFRSRDGIYARLSKDFPDLPDPQSMFDIKFFHTNPYPFFRFAKEIYPGSFKPSLSHRFIQHLEASGRLLRNYTQNIDTLEGVAGINNVVYCHGSFATASCMNCKLRVKADDVKEEIFAQRVPYCKNCTVTTEGGLNILKPDIVFFGEGLSDEFHTKVKTDKEQADLLIVIGSSLKVRPVALIPSLLRADIPQILINREQLPHMQFDVELYGNCDDVIHYLCSQLGSEWSNVIESYVPSPLNCEKYKSLFESSSTSCDESTSVPTSVPSTEAGIHDKHAHSSDKSEDTENSAKRRISVNADESDRKHQKTTIDENSRDVHYMFYPPNSYIFHGAEIDSSDDSDEENSGDQDESTDISNNQSASSELTSSEIDEMSISQDSGRNSSSNEEEKIDTEMIPAEVPTTTEQAVEASG